jgi:uncharacterized protein YfbU (UPF0304 family)
MTLTKFERISLANQCRLLARAYPEDATQHLNAATALERGYTREYPFSHVDEELSEEDCNFVYDVLDMHSWLQHCVGELPKDLGLDAADVVFPGFDGNSETEYMGYARHIGKDLGLYTDLKIESFNSHMHSASGYRSMLERYKEEGGVAEHDASAIKRILGIS